MHVIHDGKFNISVCHKRKRTLKKLPFHLYQLIAFISILTRNSYSCQLEITYTEVEIKYIQIKQVSSQGEWYEITSD